MNRPDDLGETLSAAIALACHALAHWRDGELEDCRPLVLEALERLRKAVVIMGQRE